jgi:hypothetical protein
MLKDACNTRWRSFGLFLGMAYVWLALSACSIRTESPPALHSSLGPADAAQPTRTDGWPAPPRHTFEGKLDLTWPPIIVISPGQHGGSSTARQCGLSVSAQPASAEVSLADYPDRINMQPLRSVDEWRPLRGSTRRVVELRLLSRPDH